MWLFRSNRGRIFLLLAALLSFLALTLILLFAAEVLDARSRQFLRWRRGNEADRLELVTVQKDACPGAPFILPAEGFVGLLYADPRGPYSNANPHQGIDIFSNSEPGVTPVYAAYNGYITREADWRSTLIQRVPEDPLNPERQLWLYYTHMASQQGEDFIIDELPPGTKESFVEQGTLLGYTGNYSGASLRGVWVHLHFSIVKDDDLGSYTNELDIANTVDPSKYLGLDLNYESAGLAAGDGHDCATDQSDD